jgi:hypothetical protein
MSLREPQSLLHNMSAPPRAQIGFRAVRPAEVSADEGEVAACGLRWLARFDAAGLLAPPFEPGVLPDLAEERHRSDGTLRLRLGLARARAEAAGEPLPKRVPRRIAVLPVEAVADALREVAAELPLAWRGLPAFGLLLPARDVRACVRGVCLTIAVLARRRGTVFLRDAAPLAPASFDGPMLDLWAPAPLPASKEGPCRAS